MDYGNFRLPSVLERFSLVLREAPGLFGSHEPVEPSLGRSFGSEIYSHHFFVAEIAQAALRLTRRMLAPDAPTLRLAAVLAFVASAKCTPGRAPPAAQATRIEDVHDAVGIEVSGGHACVLRRGGNLECFGDRACLDAGARVGRVRAMSLALDHACAVTNAGIPVCWGKAVPGLGSALDAASCMAPQPIAPIRDAVSISTSADHTCVLRQTGQVVCVGESDFGKLGAPTRNHGPVVVPGIADAEEIVTTPFGACVVTRAGALGCWGAGAVVAWEPRAASGPTRRPVEAELMPRFLAGVDDVVAYGRGCVLRRTGHVECWSTEERSLLDDDAVARRVEVRGLSDGVRNEGRPRGAPDG